jgi:hypothetical protein
LIKLFVKRKEEAKRSKIQRPIETNKTTHKFLKFDEIISNGNQIENIYTNNIYLFVFSKVI